MDQSAVEDTPGAIGKYKAPKQRSGSALCLSGGGFRAALFHLGALRRLNEVGLLSKMNTISSVSGGSIVNGFLARVWPSLTNAAGVFTDFEEKFEGPLRAFCGKNLRTGPLLWDRLNPLKWMTLMSDDHSATDFLAEGYRDHLLGDLRLKDLAEIEARGGPKFVIDATDLQTGVNFEFSGSGVGDYKIGWGPAPELLVAEAVAASSSFPIAFPPLVLKFPEGTFRGGWIERHQPTDPNLPKLRRRVVLTDGGVYDNLGLEPVWKTHELVLCSDGGKPLDVQVDPGESPVTRLPRANAVIMNQAQAVRTRWLVAAYHDQVYRGGYWGIATEIAGYPVRENGYPDDVLQRLRAVRTDMDSFEEGEQLVLMNHGWCLADAALRSYVAFALPAPVPPGKVPSSTLLDPAKALAALSKSDQTVWLGR